MLNPVTLALERAARTRGSEPLLTWYGAGARVEFSVRTFANWVDKTANLIEASEAAGGTVAGLVSRTSPGNWMSLVWPLAAWQRGCAYALTAAGADLVVVGPDDPRPHPGSTTLACSLHPLALGLRELPDGVDDYSGEALAQPDAHWATEAAADAPAWLEPGRSLSHAEVGQLAGTAERRLVRTSDPLGTLQAAVVAPLLGGGSSVLVDEPADADRLAALCRSERAVLA